MSNIIIDTPKPLKKRSGKDVDIRRLAKTHTRTALSIISEIMENEENSNRLRMDAAVTLLEWGWGKPKADPEDDPQPQLPQEITINVISPTKIES